MQHIISIWVFLLLGTGTEVMAQHEKYSKVQISLIGKDISDLAKAGLEIDHGKYVRNRTLINDFNQHEIQVIKSLGFDIQVLIDDVSDYYGQPNRPSELIQNHFLSRANCYLPSVSTPEYTTPKQYKEGSMGGYFTYEEMLDILDTMAARYPNIISTRKNIDGFTTYEGNQLVYVKVSDDVHTNDIAEPEVLYTALHHGREPVSLTQMIFYLWYILENYGKDSTITKIVNQTQMYFLPCVNPDGYKLNQMSKPNGGGLWRKNTWKDTTNVLIGVDLNRNYGHFWGFNELGSSSNPSSITYRGQYPFSEPETQAVRSFCLQHDFKMGINYHTFGNFLIYPWGYNDLPTDEDVLFKSMSRVLTGENGYIFGTGTQTVGYTVNGDAADWMYGRNDEKGKIYTFTAEVGPSFWPPKEDIDYLNKSCLRQNISTALLTSSYFEVREITNTQYLTPSQSDILVHASSIGLKKGNCTVTLKSLNPGVTVVQPVRNLSLDISQSENIKYTVNVSPGRTGTQEILFELIVENEGIIQRQAITKYWINSDTKSLYYNKLTDIKDFKSNGWNTTDSIFVSAPSSVTDSPTGLYPPNFIASITIAEPFDLQNAEQAFLHFYAKWDIENDYDYAQVLVSTDNKDFVPLCGRYTNLGTRQQSFSSPLYDGVQQEWVEEEIDLSFFAGRPEVWIRFLIVTDEFEQRDGFYFDDLEIRVTNKTVSSLDEAGSDELSLFPNILNGGTILNISEPLADLHPALIIED
ncbi:MAG: M14 family zinc carboxypeptidase, partial [Saprospiraceae bacterium]